MHAGATLDEQILQASRPPGIACVTSVYEILSIRKSLSSSCDLSSVEILPMTFCKSLVTGRRGCSDLPERSGLFVTG